ncbi:MAG: DUF4838 domain-containing protein [Candidatus Omnitrophica bacterium]|nr:DUF4838 domain-containing protein [Candidatus Omnitrophota bacterium]
MSILNRKYLRNFGLTAIMLLGISFVSVPRETVYGDESTIVEYSPQGLSSSGWSIKDEISGSVWKNAADLSTNALVTDNNPVTFVTTTPDTLGKSGFVIDLGVSTVVDRVYVTGPTTAEGQSLTNGNPANWVASTKLPLGMIRVYVGNAANPTTLAGEFMVPYDAGNPVDTEADIRFQPVAGQYIRVEMQTAGIKWSGYNYKGGWPQTLSAAANLPWSIAEIEVHGFAGQSNIIPKDAVVLPPNAADAYAAGVTNVTIKTSIYTKYMYYLPLIVAANDLSYYLGKLTGRPVPIVTAAQAAAYPGTIYTIDDLQPQALDYVSMVANEKSGILPADVSVVAQGNQVKFSGWPYRNVLKSVWTFLAAQGIHWVYPTPHGDYIPVKGDVDLSMLPLNGTSLALGKIAPPKSVYANWNVAAFLPWYTSVNQTSRQGFLNLWRQGWNSSWNYMLELGGLEVPKPVPITSTIDVDYATYFDGASGNFNKVIPLNVLKAHDTANDSWCGYDPVSLTHICNDPAVVLPSTWPSWKAMAFDMTNPDLIDWVAAKMTAVSAFKPVDTSGTVIPMHNEFFGLVPLDASGFDKSARSLQANSSSATESIPIPNPVPWVTGYPESQSGAYFNFVNQVAIKVKQQNPVNPPMVGALAYAEYFLPPPAWEVPVFSSNIRVNICQYGSPNLPMSSPRNAVFKDVLDRWYSLSGASGMLLGNWDYTLLHTDYGQKDPHLPVPMVAAIVDHAAYLGNMGALEGMGSQATASSFPYNPWNFYAYPRVHQNLQLTANQIEQEFFTSYFKEAAAPMLAYYQAMENWQVKNDVNMLFTGYGYDVMPASFPVGFLNVMKASLQQAQGAAKSWIVQKRVADIVSGFNWVITRRGLDGVDLGNRSLYPVLGQDTKPYGLFYKTGSGRNGIMEIMAIFN